MAVYYPGCAESIVDPILSDCPDKELGDIRSIALVKKSFSFTDITDEAEWAAGIAARNIYVFPYVRGSKEVSEFEQPGFGDEPTTIDSYDFNVNTFHPDYANTWAFWQSVNKSKNFKLAYRTETKVHLTDGSVQINAKAPIAEDKKQAILWNVSFKFTQEFAPEPFDSPVGVFDRVIAVS